MTRIAITGALLILQDGPRQLTLHIGDDQITAIGGSPQPGEKVIDLTGHALFPGLINAHDHLHMNVFPRTRRRERYAHANDWYRDTLELLDEPPLADLNALPLNSRLLIGGFKNLLAGVTTVIHHDELYRPLRSRQFPVRIPQRYGWVHSLAFEPDVAASYRRTADDEPWMICLAEGTNALAAKELYMLEQIGCLGENTVLVHGVGLTPSDIERVIEAGAGLIWCPESNRYVLGEARFHSQLVGRMALGTDSRMTGSRDLLEELKVAADLSGLPAWQIVQMATTSAARLLRLPDAGRLAHSQPADLIALAAEGADPYELLVSSHRADLRLVMLGGRPRIADPDLEEFFQLTRTSYQEVHLDGVPKLLARDLYNRLGRSGLTEPGLELH